VAFEAQRREVEDRRQRNAEGRGSRRRRSEAGDALRELELKNQMIVRLGLDIHPWSCKR
jgi:hypothetical protein